MEKEIQDEKEIEEVIKFKNRIVKWIKKHKKQLVYIGMSILLIFLSVIDLTNTQKCCCHNHHRNRLKFKPLTKLQSKPTKPLTQSVARYPINLCCLLQ